MNSQLRKLERLSRLDVYGLGTDRAKWEATIERFAKMIVQECIEINSEELAFNAFEQLTNRYKERFGEINEP